MSEQRTLSPEEELVEATEARRAMRELTECEGWKALSRVVNEQAQIRANIIQTGQLTSLDSCFEKATQIGERLGMLMVLRLADSILETINERIEELQDEQPETGSEG